jgi:hypothetical protein
MLFSHPHMIAQKCDDRPDDSNRQTKRDSRTDAVPERCAKVEPLSMRYGHNMKCGCHDNQDNGEGLRSPVSQH